MSDARIEEAQRLFWEIQALRELGAGRRALVPKLVHMAELHEARARELLARTDAEGWTDFFAAVTAWANAGHGHHARDMIELADSEAVRFTGSAHLKEELRRLTEWLGQLAVVPTLAEFAVPLPASDNKEAA